MTDIKLRSKFPFTVVSSSVDTGYAAALTASVGQNIDIVNYHKDEYGELEGSPAQGPFTKEHVGGNQHRHIKLNDGSDDADNRPEAFIVSASANSIKIYGPDIKGVDKPRAQRTRGLLAKSPVNIKNIETSGNIAGNFNNNYEVVQTVGRRTTNNLINDNFIASGALTTQFLNNAKLLIDDNLSSYTNGDKLTSNQYFFGDGSSEIRTETSTSDKYFVLNNSGANSRFLKINSKFKQKVVISYKAIVNRDNSTKYDIPGLNLERPDNNEHLLLQYSFDLINWNTFKIILTGSNTVAPSLEIIENTDIIELPGSYYLRFFQTQHSGINTDNYGLTNIKIQFSFYGDYSLPEIQQNSKSIFVERFNAPGGKQESSRGALDREGEEYSPNNSLVTRNIKVRQPFYNQLTQHTPQFNSGSTYKLLPDNGIVNSVAIHGVNRNTINKIGLYPIPLFKEASLLTGSLATSLNDQFGVSISLNSEGNVLAVGAPFNEKTPNGNSSGVVYIYNFINSNWSESIVLTGSLAIDSDDGFGISVSLNSKGNVLVVGASLDEKTPNPNFSGVAYIFNSGSSGWIETAVLTGSLSTDANDFFGIRTCLNSEGNILAIGASGDEKTPNDNASGVVYIFNSGSSGWIETAVLTGSLAINPSDTFGASIVFNSEGNVLAVGSTADEKTPNSQGSGVVYIFNSGSSGWVETAVLTGSLATESSDAFGTSVSLNSEGNTLAVGCRFDEKIPNAQASGVAYIFNSGSSGWIQAIILTGSLATNTSDAFGTSVSLNSEGDTLVVGSIGDQKPPNSGSSGVVYVFNSGSFGWVQSNILTGSLSSDSSDNFGGSVAINSLGDIIAIGAINDEKVPNSNGSGVVYINKVMSTIDIPAIKLRYDNFWIQHTIPSTDLRYKWIADSVSSSQQPIEYQSYGGEYTRAAAFTDLDFEQQTPFGDHLGISGAVDKEEMFTSNYTNTMYRERKYLNFTASNDFYVDASDIAGDISSRDFSLSFWTNIPEDTSIGRNLESLNFIHSSSVLTQENGPTGMFIDSTGVRLFVVGTQADSVHQYSLSRAWDVTSKSFIRSRSVTLDEGNPTGIFFKSDGTRMYVVGSNNSPRTLKQYDLGTAWDISTVGAASTFGFGATAIPQDLFISPDGTKMFIVRSDGDVSTEYNLSTPWDATTAAFVRTVAIPSTPGGSHTGISFSHDGRYMYVLRNEALDSQDDIFMYYLPNAWSLLGATLVTSKNIGDKLNVPRGMFVKPDDTTRMYVIGDMGADSLIYEFSLNNIFDLINYSGSASDNYLKAAFTETSSYLYLSGSETENNILIKPQINDSLWHNIVIVSDVSTAIKRITTFNGTVIQTPQNTTVTKIYVDGALVTEATQLHKKLDISKLIVSTGRYGQTNNSAIDEVSVWDSALSEEQVNKIFKVSKSAYGKQPKKYKQHLFDSDILQKPLHVYSSRIDDVTNIIFDEMSKQDVELVNYTASVNLKPDTNQIISYSTYFNGPYGSSNWKSIRNNEHPVTRNLSTQNTNIISVLIPETNRENKTKAHGIDVIFTLPPSRKQGTLLNVKEPPVSMNKPLKHRFIFKGDTYLANKGYEITHTYQNNIKYFSNQKLNNALGLQDKTDEQMYDVFHNYYANDYTDEKDSPIEKFLGYTYNQTIFPKPENAFLKETRMRTDYITDQPGFNIDGYDRQLGTQRVFWRDNQEDRQRTQYGYINSMGSQILTASDGATSVAALEFVNTSSFVTSGGDFSSVYVDWCSNLTFNKTAELNSNCEFLYENIGETEVYERIQIPIEHIPEFYFTNNNTNRTAFSPYRDISEIYGKSVDEYACYRVHPSYVYKHPLNVENVYTRNLHLSSSIDLGLRRITEKIANKNPWYDSYEKFSEDFINLSKNYSRLNEFKISDYIKQTVKDFGGDFRKIKFIDFENNIQISLKDKIEKDNKNFVKQNKISFKLNVIKKLLPYNGFYPQDKSLHLVNDLKDSYINTETVAGGLFYSGSAPEIGFAFTASFYDNIQTTSSYTLQRYLKEITFLEPMFAPGIFYNLIKSGIAVDWTVRTGSINNEPATGYFTEYDNLSNPPTYRLPFETILDIFNGISEQESLRITRYTEMANFSDYTELDIRATNGPAQGFFELNKKNNALYSLSINNFLAETIKFFLKDSKLNSYISAPEESFSEMDENKTYYMDIVLRKTENFRMIDAYSSSVNPNFGKMTGRYFGPSYYTGSISEENSIRNRKEFYKTLLDPSYCIYTPPYFYGDSVARISFKPYGGTRKYSLSEIISNSSVEYFNLGLLNNSSFISGNLYNNIAMNVEASINLFGTIQQAQQTTDPVTGRVVAVQNNTNNNKWVLSTKMEVPVLNFIDQDYNDDTTLVTYTPAQQYIIEDLAIPNFVPLTASGFGIGMWSGYGEIPKNEEGIFFDLKESYPNKLKLFNQTSTTGSLIQACGFQKDSKRIGEIADKKVISEAIVIIPYSMNERRGSTINVDFDNITINDTTRVEDFNLFKIHRGIFNKQKINLEDKKAAIQQGNFGAQTDIQETSISRMIEAMQQYVIPPNLNFLEFDDIQPFVMYFAEFKTTLDKQDLADIWQGVMPKPAMKAELEDVTISQNNTLYDFFHGEGLPEDVRFMIFKVKKKAEINYYKMTADSTDDNLFPEIQVGKGPSPYSYNWPYDYFSLVELAKVDIEIDYESKDNEQVTIPDGNTVGQTIRNATNERTTVRGTANRGITRR